MSRRSSRTIYVGNLPGDTRLREVEDLFYKVFNSTFNSLFALETYLVSFILASIVLSSMYPFIR